MNVEIFTFCFFADAVFGKYCLQEKYITGAGHCVGLFGLPTFVPGEPRLMGARVTWKF